MKHSFRAFRHPNFRLFFAGQSLSVIGTWVQSIAMSWLVYRLSGSPFLLGLTWFASLAPVLVLAPLGGLLADRVNRRALLVVTQSAALVHAAAMAALAYADMLGAWGVIAFAALLGVVQACDTPLRQSFLPEMVPDRADLPSAIAFSSFMQQAGRLAGPTIAGFLLAHWSEAFCFAVNGVSKLAVIGAVVVMRVAHRPRTSSGRSAGGELADGVRYAWQIVPIRMLLPSVALVSFMAAPYQSLMPIFAAEIYHGDARTLGVLMGAAGLGGVASVLFLAARKDVRGLTRIILGAIMATGSALVAFSFCRWLWLALPLMFIVGSGIIALITAASTIIQTIVDDSKRGRVMSLYVSCFLGMVPMGSLAAGSLASVIGAPATLCTGGVFCLLGALVLWLKMPVLREHMRAIYARLDIPARKA